MAERGGSLVDIASAVGECIGRSKSVLLAGRWDPELAARLLSDGCSLAAVCADSEAAVAASPSCEVVETLDAASWLIPAGIGARRYDCIVLDGVLELCPDPKSLLASLQGMLQNGGFVAALLPYTAHGSIRLAMMRGIETEAFAGVASAAEAVELFEQCGYRVQRIERLMAPLFGQHDGLPSLEESHFDPAIVQVVRSDPESETASFLIMAHPSTEPARNVTEAVEQVESDQSYEHDRFVVAFETAFESQRRRTKLEEELRSALQEADRLRGRVIALEDALREQAERSDKSRNK